MSDTNCPYCGAEIEINHDDGYGYEESERYNQKCCNCGKRFAYETEITFSYEVFKAPCLNGGKHKYKLTDTVPKCASRMQCEYCGDERELTDDERVTWAVETVEEYYERLRKGK